MKWEYRISADEKELTIVCEIIESVIRNGRTTARMEAKLPAGTMEEELSADSKGVYRNAIMGGKLQQPVTIIKYPVRPKDEWKDKLRLGEADADCTITVKDTASVIEVPAGKFTTLALESVVELNGERCLAAIWYANGVGIVKQRITSSACTCTMELRNFVRPK
jgi:hypothetical protein